MKTLSKKYDAFIWKRIILPYLKTNAAFLEEDMQKISYVQAIKDIKSAFTILLLLMGVFFGACMLRVIQFGALNLSFSMNNIFILFPLFCALACVPVMMIATLRALKKQYNHAKNTKS